MAGWMNECKKKREVDQIDDLFILSYMQQCLAFSPSQRISAYRALEHPFLAGP